MNKAWGWIRNDSIRAYQFHQSLRLGMVILMSVFFVKLGMDVDDVSTFEWILFITNALSFFWSMGMKNAMMNFRPNISEGKEDDFIKTIMLSFLGGSLLFGGLLMISSQLGWIDTRGLIVIICAYLIFNVSSSILEHVFLWKGKSTHIFDYAAISYLSYLIIVLACYILSGYTLYGAITGLILWSFLRFLYFLYYLILHPGRYDMKQWSVFFLFSLPLIFHALIGNGMEFIDGFLVDHYFDEKWFAIYRFGARELPFNTVLISSLVTASIPLAVNSYAESMDIIKRRLSTLMHWLFPLSIVLIFTSDYLFQTFFSEDYVYSAQIFNVYLLILSIRILLPQISLYAFQKNQVLLYIAIIEIIVNIALSLWFLQIFGLIGIAYATLIAYLVDKVLLMIYLKQRLDIPVSRYLPLRQYMIYTFLLVAAYLLQRGFINL